MKEKRIGIFTLAISLVLLGVLFLLNNFIEMNIYDILSIAWPSIIILLGLEIVLSKAFLGKDETKTKLSISGKSIFFIILIVFITFVSSGVHRLPIYIDIDNDFLPLSYKNNTIVNKDMVIDVKDKNKLKIINSFGYVNVIKGEDKNIKIDMSVSINHNYEEEEAKRIGENILEIINNSGNEIKIINQREKYIEDNQIKDIKVNLDIVIPDNMELDIANKYGDVITNDCGNSAVISNSHGNIFVDTLNGDLDIKNAHGEIEIVDIAGKTIIENSHGKILAEKVNKDLDITNEHGSIRVSEIGGNVELENSHDSIEVEKIGGYLSIESQFCRIDIDDVKGYLKINGRHGNIRVNKIDGNVRIGNEHGSIKLVGANKSIEIKNRHSEILFESDKPISEKLEIENEHGRIDIRIPKEQEGNFNIYTRNGHIHNDFELDVDSDNNEERVNQSIGNKSVEIDIKAENGNIRIDD